MCYFGSRSLFWGTGFANSNNDDSVNEILILSKSKKYSSNFQFRPEKQTPLCVFQMKFASMRDERG